LSMILVTAAGATYLRVMHGWDRVSATLGAAPGALGQALLLAADCGCDVRSIAMVQTVRLFVLIILLPAGFGFFGRTGSLPAGLGALAASTLVACVLAVLFATLLSLRTSDVVIAYAPGGMEAMTILAFVLQLDPAFVGVHQLARFLFVALAMPFAVGWLRTLD